MPLCLLFAFSKKSMFSFIKNSKLEFYAHAGMANDRDAAAKQTLNK
jgi:hypothetical protein